MSFQDFKTQVREIASGRVFLRGDQSTYIELKLTRPGIKRTKKVGKTVKGETVSVDLDGKGNVVGIEVANNKKGETPLR